MTADGTPPIDFLKGLGSRYGIAKSQLLVLDGTNDPFNVGTPTDRKGAEWFAKVWDELDRPRVHLRDLHYALVVRGITWWDGRVYEGTAEDWRVFSTASRKARDLGLVSPWAFVDRRTQAEHRYDLARDPASTVYVSPGCAVLSRPELSVPTWGIVPATLEGDTPSSLSRQPVTVELWIEKDSDALNREVLPVAQRFGCRVLIGAGFQSKTAAADLVRRSIDDGRERIVLWLADADSKGEAMAIATARHTEFLVRRWLPEHEPDTVVPRVVMDRVALTLDQVAEVEAAIGRSIPVSPDVMRDEGRVELQALAAFAPGWVRAELERRLLNVFDSGLAAELRSWEAAADDAVEAEWDALIEPHTQACIALQARRDEVLARFDVAGLNAALDEIEGDRLALTAAVEGLAGGFDPALPDLPEGYVNIEGRDWLLDTDREYVEQLNAYRRHEPIHRRRSQLALTEGDPGEDAA